MTHNMTHYINLKGDKMNTIDNFKAVMIAEGIEEVDSEEEYIEAWQHLINTGLAWNLQGWFGRNAKSLINNGICKGAK